MSTLRRTPSPTALRKQLFLLCPRTVSMGRILLPVLCTKLWQRPAAEGQSPATDWQCKLSKGPCLVVPTFTTIIFTVTPSRPKHTSQCLSRAGHTLSLLLTATSLPYCRLSWVIFLEHNAQSWARPQEPTRPPAHPRNLLGASPWPGPELPSGPLDLRHLNGSCRHLRFKEMVPPQRQDRRRGICRKCPHCLCFPHLAQIQVRLQVIGVIELQDPPEWSPFPALPGGEGGGRETMGIKDEGGDGQGAGVTLMGHSPQLLLTPCPSPGFPLTDRPGGC